MPQHTQLEAGDGHKFVAYIAQPARDPKGGVVVLQEIFGVNLHIRLATDTFAQAGYLAIAPALFDRVERDVELGYEPAEVKKAMQLARRNPPEKALADIQATIDYLHDHSAPKVGVVGYSWGGRLAWLSNTRLHPNATVSYYPGGIEDFLGEKPTCPAMFHFGLHDAHIPQSVVTKVKEALPDTPVFTYDAGHGFNNDLRDSYDEASAKLARQRTLAHLSEHVVGKPRA